MKGIRHQVPVNSVGAHAGSLVAGEDVSATSAWRGASKAGPHPTTHRGFERHLDGRSRNLLPARGVDQRRQHRRRAAGEDINAPTLALPRGRWRELSSEQVNEGTVLPCGPAGG